MIVSRPQSNLQDSLQRFQPQNAHDYIEFFEKVFACKDVQIFSAAPVDVLQVGEKNNANVLIWFDRLNDQRRQNRFILACRDRIKEGGYFVGCFYSLEENHLRIKRKYKPFFSPFALLIHFIVHRVFPKLSFTKKLYFVVTKGQGRALSQAEVYGRLIYCGFDVVSIAKIGHLDYFVAQKTKPISNIQHPTYGLIVKLKRIGYQGKPITIRKLRTMYPYSEFIQDAVYQMNKLDSSGKIADDFRLTKWGKFLRCFWVDELPQLYNWLRGDLKLFGVRALSEHYFSLYPKDLQILRTQVKPGLFPPYYADLPKNFEEILESERKYLLKLQQHPVSTDCYYLFSALKNILFKGIRSK